MLAIEDVRQRDDFGCGRAALDAVFRFWGRRLPRDHAALTNPEQGTHPDTVRAVLRAADFLVLDGSMSVADLTHLTRAGRPVLTLLAQGGGPAGHWVVVRGVGRRRVHYHCPSNGRCSLPLASWESWWDDRDREEVGYWRWGIAPWLPEAC